MKGLKFRHVLLVLGVALLLAGIFVPWVSLYTFYYSGAYLTFTWSPFDFLWNALMSAFPNAPEINAWLIGITGANFVAVSILYVASVLGIAGLAIPLIYRDMRRGDLRNLAWPLFGVVVFAGILALLAWEPIPFGLALSDSTSAEVDVRFDDSTIGIAVALAGAALAIVGAFDAIIASRDRQLRMSGRMLAAGEETADA